MKDPLSRWEESEEGDEKESPMMRILGTLFHWLMVSLGLSIVFTIGGALLFLKQNGDANIAMDETPLSAIIRFCTGGSIAVGLLLYYYFRKKKHTV
jgi:uncharacterized protein YjeT (DUF2065 family)